MRNASGHQGENEWQWKKNKNTYYISSIKRVTRNHVEVVQNNGKETGKVAFLLIRPIVVFLTVLVAFAA